MHHESLIFWLIRSLILIQFSVNLRIFHQTRLHLQLLYCILKNMFHNFFQCYGYFEDWLQTTALLLSFKLFHATPISSVNNLLFFFSDLYGCPSSKYSIGGWSNISPRWRCVVRFTISMINFKTSIVHYFLFYFIVNRLN